MGKQSILVLMALASIAARAPVSDAATPSAGPPATNVSAPLPLDAPSEPCQAAQRAPGPASDLAGEGFSLIGETAGVKVYGRYKRPGIEIAAEGTIAAAPERVRKILTDYPRHRRWQKHLAENRVLKRGDGSLVVYQRLNLPVLDDRDFTLQATWGAEGAIHWMRFALANELGPGPVPGVVRVAAHAGGWRLEPAAGGASTHAVYRFHIDLGGSMPGWLGRGQATSDIPELFANIARQLPAYP